MRYAPLAILLTSCPPDTLGMSSTSTVATSEAATLIHTSDGSGTSAAATLIPTSDGSGTTEASTLIPTSDDSGTTESVYFCYDSPELPGTTVNVVPFRGTDTQVLRAVTFDATGSLYVAGWFTNQLRIGQHEEGSFSSPVRVPFVTKLECDGTYKWTTHGVPDPDEKGTGEAHGITVTPSQEVLITGSLHGIVNFADFSGGIVDEDSAFVAQIDSKGVFTAVKTLPLGRQGRKILRHKDGALYVVGTCGAAMSDSLFLARLNPDLKIATSPCVPGALGHSALLTDDGLIFAGTMSTALKDVNKSTQCTPSEEGFANNTTFEYKDAFVAKIDLDLSDITNWKWCTSFASAGNDAIDDLAMAGDLVLAVGSSEDGPTSVSTANCPAISDGKGGGLLVPLDPVTGACPNKPTLYPGVSNRIHGVATKEYDTYLSGQFSPSLVRAPLVPDLMAKPVTFFVAGREDLAWATQGSPDNDEATSQAYGIAISDRLAVVGTVNGGVKYDDITLGTGKDAFLLVLIP